MIRYRSGCVRFAQDLYWVWIIGIQYLLTVRPFKKAVVIRNTTCNAYCTSVLFKDKKK